MRVIIQDLDTKKFLSADGRWVVNKAEARDFQTLLRAYHFAKENTAGNFEVMLHCPDDDYSAGIVSGVGNAEVVTAEAANAESEIVFPARNFSSKVTGRFNLDFIDTTHNHLN
jgi:hypothetical protein